MILVKVCRSNTRPTVQCLLLLHTNAVVVGLLGETMADCRVRNHQGANPARIRHCLTAPTMRLAELGQPEQCAQS